MSALTVHTPDPAVEAAAAEIVGKLASLVLFAYIARELGEGTLGDFVFALALAQIIWAVAGFGLDDEHVPAVRLAHGDALAVVGDALLVAVG